MSISRPLFVFKALVLLVVAALLASASSAADKIVTVGTAFLGPNRGHAYQGITMPSIMPLNAIYDTLTIMDEDGTIGPSLATAWHSDDALTWRFTLREGVSFSNGVPFTSEAIVESVKHMQQSPDAGAWTISTTLYQVANARAVDELTVDIELSQRDALFPLHVSVWRVPEPGAWSTLSRTEYEANPVGTGPFQVERWSEARVVMRAFKDSWRAPKLDGLSFIEVPDQTARL